MGRRARKANRQSKVDIEAETKAEPQTLQNLETDKHSAPSTLCDLRADRDLWYKICVLVYDLHNLAKDHNSEKRTLSTIDALYLSTPYFSVNEAARIKTTMIKPTVEESVHDEENKPTMTENMSVEDAITSSLANFFEKRRASGHLRPCGPHTLAPIYRRVFRIDRAEIEDERFLSRLRRSGLGI